MPRILISYRRSDSSALAGRIFDRLSLQYGEDSVFMDVDSIPIGTDFRQQIQQTLQRTDVLIAVIGANWLGRHGAGVARILEKTDSVRLEIETALERQIRIIPVLVDGAKMPASSELPPAFGNFVFLNAAEVATGRDFRPHMDRLISAIDQSAPGDPYVVPARSLSVGKHGAVSGGESMPKSRLTEGLRYVVVPLVLLLVAHHLIVNAFDLNTNYLWLISGVVPFVFGFALFWVKRRGEAQAFAFAVALGVAAVVGMTVSQSLNSGDPIMPQTRFEWWDNINFAAIIALSFLVGHALARALRAALSRNPAKP
jgi:hypothetical protein